MLRWTIIIGAFFFAANFAYTADATILGSGELTMYGDCSVALAEGSVRCIVTLDGDATEPKRRGSDKESDFWYEVSGSFRGLRPQNRTKFAAAGTTDTGKVGCQKLSYRGGAFRVDKLTPGSRVCVLTASGQYGELILKGLAKAPNTQAQFTYVLWK